MKLVNMSDLKSDAVRLPGASPGGDTKKCIRCLNEKDEIEFNFKNKAKNQRHSFCKICFKEYHKHYYQNNKNVYDKARQKLIAKGYRSDKQLTEYINSFKKNGCVLCGEKFYGALDFHHIDPKQKDKSIARATSKAYVKKEIEKCIVLCSNCHRKFHGGHVDTIKALELHLITERNSK
mgnify:FL=1